MTAIAGTSLLGVGSARRLRLRHLWLVPGIGLALVANIRSSELGVGLAPVLIFGIVPHLTVLLGFGQPHLPGGLAPRAVPLFNVMHHPAVPVAVLGLAALLSAPFWLVGALAWISHIVADWGFGGGLRAPDGLPSRGLVGRRAASGE